MEITPIKKGFALITVLLFSVLLTSIFGLWLQKKIFLSQISKTQVNDRIFYLEAESLYPSIYTQLSSLTPTQLLTADSNFLVIRKGTNDIWTIQREAITTQQIVELTLTRNSDNRSLIRNIQIP